MLQILSQKTVLFCSFFFMVVMFYLVMFVANPLIDGADGLSVIKLQLAFDKTAGVEIINAWGTQGQALFKQWIITDYFYAAAYSIFFASLLSLLIVKKRKANVKRYTWVVVLSFVAGFFDWLENTLELLFLNNPENFSDGLFFLHSIIASLKWAAVPIAVVYIVVLLNVKR